MAEDALQETYIKVWQKYSTYKGQADEKTWITRIAINVCKNYLRAAWFKRTETMDIIEIAGTIRGGYKQVDNDMKRKILNQTTQKESRQHLWGTGRRDYRCADSRKEWYSRFCEADISR